MSKGLAVYPVSADRWPDLERLFGPNGAYSGCWCTYYRLTGREFSQAAARGGQSAKALLRDLVEAGPAPGLLAYSGASAVGWCALAPREEYGRVLRSPLVKPIEPDDAGVWAITCFFVHREHRNSGVAEKLLGAAVEHAAAHGARAVEGYPVQPGGDRAADLYPGTVGMFQRAGFDEVRRRTPRRVVMRRAI